MDATEHPLIERVTKYLRAMVSRLKRGDSGMSVDNMVDELELLIDMLRHPEKWTGDDYPGAHHDA